MWNLVLNFGTNDGISALDRSRVKYINQVSFFCLPLLVILLTKYLIFDQNFGSAFLLIISLLLIIISIILIQIKYFKLSYINAMFSPVILMLFSPRFYTEFNIQETISASIIVSTLSIAPLLFFNFEKEKILYIIALIVHFVLIFFTENIFQFQLTKTLGINTLIIDYHEFKISKLFVSIFSIAIMNYFKTASSLAEKEANRINKILYEKNEEILTQAEELTEYSNKLLESNLEINTKNSELSLSNVELKRNEEELQRINSRLKATEGVLTKAYFQIKDKERQIEAQNSELINSKEEILNQKEQIQLQQQVILNKNTTINNYTYHLVNLAKSKNIQSGLLGEALNEIVETCTKIMNISMCSIWEYSESDRSITCIAMFDIVLGNLEKGTKFYYNQVPKYFEAIMKEQIILAEDARNNEDTKEFANDYLIPNNIFSMLDLPYFIEGNFKGIICCEVKNERRDFSPEDISFVSSIAEIISIAIKSNQRLLAEEQIIRQQQEIKYKNDILLAQQREIQLVNDHLEERVKERTNSLEQQNKHLAEYAFINSHLLRGPLARVMGLINIMEKESGDNYELQLICKHLKTSAFELDDIVTKINTNLNSGKHFDRDSIKIHPK